MRILLILLLFCGLKTGLAAAPFDKGSCGCPLNESRFGNKEYVKKQGVLFSVTALRRSFEQPNIDTPKALAIMDIILKDYALTNRADLQTRLRDLDAEFIGLLGNEPNLRKNWNTARKKIAAAIAKNSVNINIWTIHTACVAADFLHQYYTIFPRSQEENKIAASENSQQKTLIDMQTTIIIAAAAAGISLILAIIIMLIIVGRQKLKPAEATQAVLKSPEFNSVFNKFAASIEGQINAALSDQNQRLAQRIEQQSGNNSSQEIAALEQKISQIPTVDVGLIERLLNDFNGRIAKLEQSPKTKYEIHFSAEEFNELLSRNRELINVLREQLHVNTLQATIMSLLPKPLDLKTLDEVQQETIRHHWRLFSLNSEYLPAFKAQIMQQVQDAIQRAK
jgi:hypothetical protein